MPLSTRLAVFASLALPLGTALAQSSPSPDPATLLKKIEEQDKRIQALEHKLEVLENQQAAASGGAQSPAVTNAGQPASAGQQAASATAQAANKAPPVPQTTGALPGSPS